jgi:hypothetical protein
MIEAMVTPEDDTDMTIEEFEHGFAGGAAVVVVSGRPPFSTTSRSPVGVYGATHVNHLDGSQMTAADRQRDTYVVSNRELASVGNFVP